MTPRQAEPETSHFFADEDFQDRLVALLVRDAKTLQECAAILNANDFRPQRGMKRGRPRWIVAGRALEHYHKHREPIGALLRADVLEYAAKIQMGSSHVGELSAYLKMICALKVTAPDALTGKVVGYKRERIRAATLEEMVELQASGQLTDELWSELCRRGAVSLNGGGAVSYTDTLEARLQRRRLMSDRVRAPWTFIDPLDSIVMTVAPKQLGMVLAPYGRGKSMFLLWIAVACTMQRRNVLYVTLEDPIQDMEDRLDAIVTAVPMKTLADYPQTVAKRFNRWRAMTTARLRICDGTEGGVTVQRIEQMFLQERDRGFLANVVIVDYDDEIVPAVRQKERRFELAEIYRELRQFASRYDLIVWTAAQTQRGTEHMKVLSGDRVAEDISKLRKVTFGISLGRGEWTDESIYLWVCKHKFDRSHVGCEIVPDLKRSLIYDREATRKAYNENVGERED